MSGRLFILFMLLAGTLYSQEANDLPFQVLIAKNANIYGKAVAPLQMVDDVTSIEVGQDGFLCLVHKGGTTYEFREKIFTFYLKPEKLKDRPERPSLDLLYLDSTSLDPTKLITVVSPPFDRSSLLVWNKEEPLKIYWHLHDEPVMNYILSVSDNNGNKIQDFRTKKNEYELKPMTYGLPDPIFNFKITSTFAGETIESKTYTVQLEPAPIYEKKAADYVLKALDLELSPVLALNTWKEVLEMPNGKEYLMLFEKFLIRNSDILTAAGEDIQQLLSQSK